MTSTHGFGDDALSLSTYKDGVKTWRDSPRSGTFTNLRTIFSGEKRNQFPLRIYGDESLDHPNPTSGRRLSRFLTPKITHRLWRSPLFVPRRKKISEKKHGEVPYFRDLHEHTGEFSRRKMIPDLSIYTIKGDENLDPLNPTSRNPSTTFSTPRTTLMSVKDPTVVK